MKIKRRDFLKLTAVAGATAALSSCTSQESTMNALAATRVSGKMGELPGEWKPTTCQGCTTWCPAEVFVQDGRAVKVKGNRYSKQNEGKIYRLFISNANNFFANYTHEGEMFILETVETYGQTFLKIDVAKRNFYEV